MSPFSVTEILMAQVANCATSLVGFNSKSTMVRKKCSNTDCILTDGVPVGVKLKSFFFDNLTEKRNFLAIYPGKFKRFPWFFLRVRFSDFRGQWTQKGLEVAIPFPFFVCFILFLGSIFLFFVSVPLVQWNNEKCPERWRFQCAHTMSGQEEFLWGRSGMKKVSFLCS